MTYCKGLNKEELELYRERILRHAKPKTAEIYMTGLDEQIERLRQSHYEDEELNYILSIAPEWIVANRVVGLPLHLIISYIRGVVRLKEPWCSINSQSGNFPLLTINQIYKCLCNLCDENKGMVFAQLESTDYDVRQRLILFLNNKQERNFLRLVKSRLTPSDTVILSNICWNQNLAETVFIGYFDGSKYHLYRSMAKKEEVEEEMTLSDIRKYFKNIFAFYSWDRGFYESTNNKEFFSEEDRQVIDEIIARPEGKPLDELYRKLEEYNKERRRQLGLIDNPDEQGQPEAQPREQEQDVDENPEGQPGSDKKTPGREPEKWFKRACTEEEFGQIIKKNIWPYLRDELRRFNYGIDKERAKVKFNDAVKTSAAALIVYCSDKIGLTTTSPVSSFSKSMERTFAFLPAPRTTASLYLKRLATWYEKLKDASKERVKDEKSRATLAKWKRDDSVRGTFIVENTYNLKILIENNIPHLLAKYFDVKTDIVYKEMGTSFDKALYKPVEHKDNIKKNENGHQQKTGIGMSDGSDKD